MIGIGVSVLVLVIVVWTAAAAAAIGGEASTLDSMMKAAVQNHEPVDSVLKKVNSMGFEMKPAPSPSNPSAVGIKGRGPDHWAVVYRTWLTLNVDGGPDQATNGYHIDRAGSIF